MLRVIRRLFFYLIQVTNKINKRDLYSEQVKRVNKEILKPLVIKSFRISLKCSNFILLRIQLRV